VIKSMTGFASVDRELETVAIGVTARSVNHRHLDVHVRLPSRVAPLETELRGLVQKWIGRGRLELTVSIRAKSNQPVEVVLNEPLVGAIAEVIGKVEKSGLVSSQLTAGDVLRFPGAVTVQNLEEDQEGRERLSSAVNSDVERALEELDAMRAREGEYLRVDLDARCGKLAELVEQLNRVADKGYSELVAKLEKRVADICQDAHADESVVAQEIVRFAAKSDVSEEVTRLRGHVDHWRTLSDAVEPCGRRLDFLLQEMNREINTLGAKVEGLGASGLIVDAKSELEKMREQVQNVE